MSAPVSPGSPKIDTLGELARFNAAVRGGREALLFEGRSTSYGEFHALSNQVANGLLAEGLRAGARIGFMGKASDQFFEVVFGAAKAGIVPVGINWRLALSEVVQVLNDCGAEVLFVGPEFWSLAENLGASVPALRRIIAMGSGHPLWSRFEDWRDLFPDEAPRVPVHADDVALQMYTSGTTGQPKGVQLAHRSFFAFQSLSRPPDMAFEQWSDDDVNLVAMPAYHIGGVGWGIAGLRAGALNIVLREFDPGAVLEAIERYRVTRVFLVPAAMRLVLEHPAAAATDFGSLKYITYAASPIPLDLLRKAIKVFKCGFVQLYGMTETTGGATYLPPCDHVVSGSDRMRSAGKAFPGVRLKIVDASGDQLPSRGIGEICIRSPANMVGYWNLPDATKETLIDGYVHTGDIGYLDEDGYVYVLDRAKDMIVSGGENVSPVEVETVLNEHPAVEESAVIGVPDDRWGEAIKAIVTIKPGASVDDNDLIAFARLRLAGYKLPKTVEFVSSLPRNPTGKVLRSELRKAFRAPD